MDTSEDKKFVATGERGKYPKIYIWDSQTMIEMGVLQHSMTAGIRVIKFSPDGSKLLAVTCDQYNTIYMFNLANCTLITKTRGDRSTILDATWVTNTTFVTVGIKHFKKWDLREGRLRDKKGLFGQGNKILICAKRNHGQVIVGTYNGCLQVWKGHRLEKELPIMDKCIDCITVTEQK